MSEWTGNVQTRLDAGEEIIICPAVHVKAKSFSTAVIEPLGLWQGGEALINYTVNSEPRTYIPAGDALSIEVPGVQAGLIVQGQRVTIRGINQTIYDLQRAFDLNSAPLEIHDIALSTGFELIGHRQIFTGFIDGTTLSFDDSAGTFSVIATSALRRGTRTLDAMLDETRDPIFKYVSFAEGDSWG